jgi:3-hydroxyisobutyrate dehydrogenase-like beta-hydroxyacid dehydrogenase
VPVSGGVGGAAAGNLVALMGGAAEDIAIARPWIACFASRLIHLGPLGSGQWAKLCNQAIICGTMALWSETVALARAGGLDPEVLVGALEGATADSRVRATFGADIAAGTFTPSANLRKDIAVVVEHAGGQAPTLAAAARVFKALRDRRS